MRWLIALSVMLSSLTFGQNAAYYGIAIDASGTPLVGQKVAICTQPANTSTTPCSPLTTTYTDSTLSTSTSTPGITTTEFQGKYKFYVQPGLYTLQIYGPQIPIPQVQADIHVNGVNPTMVALARPTKTGLGFTNAYNHQGTYSQSDTALGVNFADTVATTPTAVLEGDLMAYPVVPFTYTAQMSLMPRGGISVCMAIAASTSGAVELLVEHDTTLGTTPTENVDIEDWTAPGTFSATVGGTQFMFMGGPYIWMRYQDDGTNSIYSISYDGINFDKLYQVAKASDFLATNGGYHFFGLIIAPYNTPGGTIMMGQKMTTP